MAFCAITICGMRHRIAYASSHNAGRRSSDVVAGLLRGLRGVESASHLGGDYRPALGGVPAFSFLVSLRGLVCRGSRPWAPLKSPTASPSRDLFQLLSKPISR